MNAVTQDPRIEAFCSPASPDVFHSVVGATEVWREDPFDVEVLHGDVRETFNSLLNKALIEPVPGRILTILGESGSGKTHLMRAFRNRVHSEDAGYFGYLQLTSPSPDYGRFLLTHLIDSLNHPYQPDEETTALMRLSNALAEMPRVMHGTRIRHGRRISDALTALREWDIEGKELAGLVRWAVKRLVSSTRFTGIDTNLLTAMLYLQAQDPFVKNIVFTYLRSGRIAPAVAGAVPLLTNMEGALSPDQVVAELARLMWATQEKVLVICADQLDEMVYLDDAETQVNRALGALVNLSAAVPSSVVVISCLEAVYDEVRDKLTAPIRSKIEVPPSPVRLSNLLVSRDDIEALIAKRISVLCEAMNAPYSSQQPIFPIPWECLDECVGIRPRQLLSLCAQFHQQSISIGSIPRGIPCSGASTSDEVDVEKTELLWQRHLSQHDIEVPTDKLSLARILAKALPTIAVELKPGAEIHASMQGENVLVTGTTGRFLIGVCNKKPQGGGLLREVREFENRAGGERMVIVRSGDFPTKATSQVSIKIGEIIARGGRRSVVEDPDWRTLMVFPTFVAGQENDRAVRQWRRQMRPLTRYTSVQRIIGVTEVGGELSIQAPTGFVPTAPERPEGRAATQATEARIAGGIIEQPAEDRNQIMAGSVDGMQAEPVEIDLEKELTRHAAFLGGTGSGKSTLAMNLVEQLLLNGIPVLLVDRKGDLASYANPSAWARELEDSALSPRRNALHDRVEVELFTPGHPRGRPLSISIVPDGTHLLPPFERERIAKYSASALAQVMGLGGTHTDQVSRAILSKAIYLLTEINDPEEVLIEEIIELVASRDPALVNLVGDFDAKHFKKLYEALLTLKATRGHLLKTQGERLGAELLFGLGCYQRPGKTRLTIVSTKFFGDNLDREFFVAQMLLELGRWISKQPSDHLQAVVMFDEADIYLPATRKPATKEPMEDLLKRARSGGLGILLATQSPGDLDYKSKENIRTWFIGRVKETTALAKLKPMLSQGSDDIMGRISGLGVGQFYMAREERVQRIRGDLNAIRLEQLSEEEIVECARR
jgi:energy-coupling factor transporter ATP-binding protein EcfA2